MKHATLNLTDLRLNIVQNFSRHVDARGLLKAQVTHVGINLHQQGAVVGIDEVDAGEGEACLFVGGKGQGFFVLGEADGSGRGSRSDVGAKVVVVSALDGADDFIADDKHPLVYAGGLGDKGLEEKVLRSDFFRNGPHITLIFRQVHLLAEGAFGDFYDHGVAEAGLHIIEKFVFRHLSPVVEGGGNGVDQGKCIGQGVKGGNFVVGQGDGICRIKKGAGFFQGPCQANVFVEKQDGIRGGIPLHVSGDDALFSRHEDVICVGLGENIGALHNEVLHHFVDGEGKVAVINYVNHVTSGGIMSIESIRKKIDAVDDELVDLFKARFDLSRAMGEEKKKIGRAVYDPVREAALLSRLEKKGAPYGSEVRALYEKMVELSRNLQD